MERSWGEDIEFISGNQMINTYAANGQKLRTKYYTAIFPVVGPILDLKDTIEVLNSTSDATMLSIPAKVSAKTIPDYISLKRTILRLDDYFGNILYENGTAEDAAHHPITKVLTPEGYVDYATAGKPYCYYRKDHLGSIREVDSYTGNNRTVVQKTQYYPSGTPFAESFGAGEQAYKFTGKEMITMHGLNWQDFGARWLDNARMQFTSVDPLAEKYYSISPYAYCAGNPVNNYDSDGRDYWTTSDPATIERFMNSFKPFGENKSRLSIESFNYGSWGHASDADFIAGLTFNDENQTFYSSYGTVENGKPMIHGIQIKALNTWEGGASVETEKGKWNDKSSGAIDQANAEFAVLAGGTKPGLSLLKWTWNNIINPPPPSTINTFNANAGKSFRPGKQNSRDANLKQYPKDFQRWFHRFGKEDGNFNATTQDLREMFDEWIRMGKPLTK